MPLSKVALDRSRLLRTFRCLAPRMVLNRSNNIFESKFAAALIVDHHGGEYSIMPGGDRFVTMAYGRDDLLPFSFDDRAHRPETVFQPRSVENFHDFGNIFALMADVRRMG